MGFIRRRKRGFAVEDFFGSIAAKTQVWVPADETHLGLEGSRRLNNAIFEGFVQIMHELIENMPKTGIYHEIDMRVLLASGRKLRVKFGTNAVIRERALRRLVMANIGVPAGDIVNQAHDPEVRKHWLAEHAALQAWRAGINSDPPSDRDWSRVVQSLTDDPPTDDVFDNEEPAGSLEELAALADEPRLPVIT